MEVATGAGELTRVPRVSVADASPGEMTKARLKELCRKDSLYGTPHLNDKLYLHYKGFRAISNLDEYTGLRVLWLEGNGLARIEGLDAQVDMRTLYLQENAISKLENLSHMVRARPCAVAVAALRAAHSIAMFSPRLPPAPLPRCTSARSTCPRTASSASRASRPCAS